MVNKLNLKKILYIIHILSGIFLIVGYILLLFSNLLSLNDYTFYSLIILYLSSLVILLIYWKKLISTHKTYFLIISALFSLFFGAWILIFGLIFLGQYLQEIFG